MLNSTHKQRSPAYLSEASLEQADRLILSPTPAGLDKRTKGQREAIAVIFQQLQNCGTRPLLASPAEFKATRGSIAFFNRNFRPRSLEAPSGWRWNQTRAVLKVEASGGVNIFIRELQRVRKRGKKPNLNIQPKLDPMRIWKYEIEGLAQGQVIALWCAAGSQVSDAERVNNDYSQAVVDNNALGTLNLSFTPDELDEFSLTQEDVEYGVSQYYSLGAQCSSEFPAGIGGQPVAHNGALGTINLSFTSGEIK